MFNETTRHNGHTPYALAALNCELCAEASSPDSSTSGDGRRPGISVPSAQPSIGIWRRAGNTDGRGSDATGTRAWRLAAF